MMKEKICFVVSSTTTAQTFLRAHITMLSENFDVYLVANFTLEEKEMLQRLKLSGLKFIEIHRKINLLKDLQSFIALRRYLKTHEFLACHSVTPKAGLLAALASYNARVPNRIHIFTGQVWHTRQGVFKWFLKELDKTIIKLNTHTLVDGKSQRQYLIENKIIQEKKSFVLGKGSISGVNAQRFKPSPKVRTSFREKLKVENKVVIGFIGRLKQDKGILDLFEAFNRLSREEKNVYLLLIGYDEENILNLLTKYHNIIDSINFCFYGATNEPEKVLQAVDIFCMPSHREGFGTSVLEASCLAIPVVCSDTYGLMDAMLDGITGLRHKVGSSQDIYEKLKALVKDKKTRETMGVHGREFVVQNFSEKVITQEWIRFYSKFTTPKNP